MKGSRKDVRGFGCYVDDTGATTFNVSEQNSAICIFGNLFVCLTSNLLLQPGMSGERVITTPPQTVDQETDPVTSFPIPSERDLRQTRIKTRSATSSTASRNINFTGDGTEVPFATNLPFQPPGFHWNGAPGITTRQLQRQKEQMKKPN